MTDTKTGKEAAVAAAVESLRKAMLAVDKAALDKLTLPELTFGHATGRLENKAEFIDAFVSGKLGFTSIELTNQTISVHGSTAIVRHQFLGVRKAGGDNRKTSILTVWLQQPDQQWKLAARQAVSLP